MTLVDKLKEKLHISKHSNSPEVPPKSSSSTSNEAGPVVPPKSVSTPATNAANPTLSPKDSTTPGVAATSATSPSGKQAALPALPETEVFDHEKVTVIFVLGGPGAGKGTQCEYLVKDYGFVHLSAGDLLRAEQDRPGSDYGELIKSCIVEGQIVPMEVTVKLLENAIRDALKSPPSFSPESPLTAGWQKGKGRFLIDGFPRKMDQAIKFDESVCNSSFVLFFATTEHVMLSRLLERGKTSGRSDDNEESIKKRFKTFEETSMPVVDYYSKQDKVVEIDSSPEIHVVYETVRAAVEQRLGTTSGEVPAPAPVPVPAPAPTADPALHEDEAPVLAAPAA